MDNYDRDTEFSQLTGKVYMYIRKKRYKNSFLFKGGREHLAAYRSGRGLFLPRATFKTKRRDQIFIWSLAYYFFGLI
ncbi:hypothetical protein CON64_10505 [Bacillus pseudomycoides]|nr:hypothetical protein CON64_10505 [Bacillus pseudomycoides]